MIRVSGDPLSTVAGIAAAASTGVGALSVLGAGMAAGGGGSGSGPGGAFTQEDATAEQRRKNEEEELKGLAEGASGKGLCFLFALLAFALLLLAGTSALMMAVVVPAVNVKRRSWPFVVGPIGGLLTGLGAGVLLQQYAIVYPTRTWGIIYIAGGLAFGLAVPMLRRALSR